MTIKVAVVGAAGRMGATVCEAVEAAEAGLARRCGSGCGTWPAGTHQRLESALSVRW